MKRERGKGPGAVVIGSGHNGLVAAIRLAKAGFPVTVLERAPVLGGALSSAELTLPGYIHDPHAAFFPLGAVSPAFRRLSLGDHGVQWINPETVMAHPFEDGSAITLHRQPAATAESLERAAIGAGRSWERLIRRFEPQSSTMMAAAMSPFPPVRPLARLALRTRLDGFRLARQVAGSAARMGIELFRDRRAAGWFAGSTCHGDVTPTAPASAAMAFGLLFLGQTAGWPLVRGGSGRLTDALAECLADAGGRVRRDAEVATIDVVAGKVTGVRLRDGERIAADVVVATVGPRPLLDMLPPSVRDRKPIRRLGIWRYGTGTFKLDLALSGPVPWINPDARRAAVVHLCGELDELFEAARDANRGLVPRKPAMVIGQQSVHDPTRAPAGRHTLYVYARMPNRPKLADAEITLLLEEQIERFAPGFRELILERAVSGPASMEAENPALVGGDLSSGSVSRDQLLLFRPGPRFARGRTPVPGLYVAGGSVHPGPGVHGLSGEAAARVAIADSR